MALINPSDIPFFLVPETVAGVIPSTGTRYELPIEGDQQTADFSNNDIVSNTKRPGRAGNGSRPGMTTGTGSLSMRLQSAPVFNILLESALSGKFTTTGTKTLKAGTVDSTFTILANLIDGASGSALVEAASNCMVSKLTIAGKYGEGITMSVDYLSTVPGQLNSVSTLTLGSLPSTAFEFMGGDGGSLAIGGLASFQPTEFSLEVTQERNARGKLFTNTPIGIGTASVRTVSLMVGGYREDFGPETAVTGNVQSVNLNIGAAGNGYGFFLPSANGVRPKTTFDNESAKVEMTFNAKYDNTALTDFYITQL